MTITAAANKLKGVKTFYVLSDSGKQYVVTHIRREGMCRWSCTCPDFTFRRQLHRSGRFCKHLKAVIQHFENLKKAAA